ncbi:MAG: hypothetical protein WCD70_12825 [Alphaproteobacteria bacterium]
MKDFQKVYPELGFFDGRQWGKWKLNITDRCLEHKAHPGQVPYQLLLDVVNDSSSMLDWIFQVSSKSWATYKDISDLVSAFGDIFDPQSRLCSGALNGTEGCQIDASTFLTELFGQAEDQILRDLIDRDESN